MENSQRMKQGSHWTSWSLSVTLCTCKLHQLSRTINTVPKQTTAVLVRVRMKRVFIKSLNPFRETEAVEEQWRNPSQLSPVNEPTARGKTCLSLYKAVSSLPEQIKGSVILPWAQEHEQRLDEKTSERSDRLASVLVSFLCLNTCMHSSIHLSLPNAQG